WDICWTIAPAEIVPAMPDTKASAGGNPFRKGYPIGVQAIASFSDKLLDQIKSLIEPRECFAINDVTTVAKIQHVGRSPLSLIKFTTTHIRITAIPIT